MRLVYKITYGVHYPYKSNSTDNILHVGKSECAQAAFVVSFFAVDFVLSVDLLSDELGLFSFSVDFFRLSDG